MSRRLFVHFANRRVGVVEALADEGFSFIYDARWLEAGDRFPLSVRLPLQEEAHPDASAFFSNLLPEADVRRSLCQRLGISNDNDFELLARIGGECAGAVTLSDRDEAPRSDPAEYRLLSEKKLTELATSQVFASLDGRAGIRLSLAGAQDKLPVYLDGDKILLPVGASPSTHILKFPNRHFRHLPANEVLTTMIARRLGLPAVDATWRPFGEEGMCVIERYDRYRTGDGTVARLHQEDLCQANGIRPTRKYEQEGGPSFQRCFETVRTHSVDPLVDGQNLLRWLAFNATALNADGHAKNLSLLYRNGGIRLTPFYDLVCTRAYPALSRDLAMAVGGESDPAHLLGSHWERLATDLGLGTRFVRTTVIELAEGLAEAARDSVVEFQDRYGGSPALQLVLPKVRRQAKRIAQQARG